MQLFDKPSADIVRAAAETLPFFCDCRIVICYDMPEAEVKALLTSVPFPDTTLLILYMRKKCPPALLKSVQANGRDVLFDALNEQDAMRFVLDRAEKRGVKLEKRVASLLVDMVGTEVHTLHNELNKAIDYANGAPLSEDSLCAIVTPQLDYQRFGMMDSFVSGQTAEALRAYATMLRDNTESVFGLAYFFTGQCKNMLMARLLLDSGVRERDIESRLHLYSKPARVAIWGARRMDTGRLREAVQAFSSVDYEQVSGRAPGERMLTAALLTYLA